MTGAQRLFPALTGYALGKFCSAPEVNQLEEKKEETHREGAPRGEASSASVSDAGFVGAFERDLDLNMTGSNLKQTR